VGSEVAGVNSFATVTGQDQMSSLGWTEVRGASWL